MIWYWTGNILVLALIIYFLAGKLNTPETQPFYFPALLLKLLAGLGVGFVYLYYYRQGDTLRFQELSLKLYELAGRDFHRYISFLFHSSPTMIQAYLPELSEEPRTLFFVKVLSLFDLLTNGNYWINSVYFSLLSFTGSWMIVLAVCRISRRLLFAALIPFALLPSMVFWSSGVLKESIAMFCFGMLVFLFIKNYLNRKFNYPDFILFVFIAVLYWLIKYYLVIVLIISMATVLTADVIETRFHRRINFPLFAGLFFLYILAGSFAHPNFSLLDFFKVLHNNHEEIIRISNKNSLIPFIPVKEAFGGFLINIPMALFAGLFMPLPLQGSSLITLGPGIINLLILFTTVMLLFKGVHFPEGNMKRLVYGAILYIFSLAVLLSYAAPNFGTLERYKISYLPLFLLLVLAGIWPWLSGRGKLIENV